MEILKKLFNNRSEDDNKNIICWNKLESISDIEEIIDQSKSFTIVIFKHSTRCGISSGVLRKFEKKISTSVIDQKLFYFLNVIKNRDVSNEIASRFNIIHQSPQLIVIKNGLVVTHDSHYDIMNIDLETI